MPINKLGQEDKSPQGFIDPDIMGLLTIFNKHYETTSSCSGRITIMRGVKKGEARWLFKQHTGQVTERQIREILDPLEDSEYVRFIYEPLIVHLKAQNQDDAQKLLEILHKNGFKKSGLISFREWVIEINDTGRMEMLISKVISQEHLEALLTEANKRLAKTKKQITKLEKLFA